MTHTPRPRIGISRCLLGDEVRFDGGHKRDTFLINVFGRFVEWVPVCPELEIGLGVPRAPIDLFETSAGLRLIEPSTGRDLTGTMGDFAARKVEQLRALNLSGYLLKSKSPSCGLGSTKVHGSEGELIRRNGTGVFAAVLRRAMPDLPIAEEADLADKTALEDFIKRIRTYPSGRGW